MSEIKTHMHLSDPDSFGDRDYRRLVTTQLKPVRVVVQETDLGIYSDSDVLTISKEAVIRQRGYLENYIRQHPKFATCLNPWPTDHLAPKIVHRMIDAGQKAQVGPMAAVAGALAEQVGRSIERNCDEIIIENGGDLYINAAHDLSIAIYAAKSPLSLKVGLKVPASPMPMAVCTSSGTVGHSYSDGRADAVCVVSRSCPLADAAATAIANRVRDASDFDAAIQWGKKINGIIGILIILGEKMGVWGRVELVPLNID